MKTDILTIKIKDGMKYLAIICCKKVQGPIIVTNMSLSSEWIMRFLLFWTVVIIVIRDAGLKELHFLSRMTESKHQQLLHAGVAKGQTPGDRKY